MSGRSTSQLEEKHVNMASTVGGFLVGLNVEFVVSESLDVATDIFPAEEVVS